MLAAISSGKWLAMTAAEVAGILRDPVLVADLHRGANVKVFSTAGCKSE